MRIRCESQFFFFKQKKSENRVRSDPLTGLGYQSLATIKKLVQTSNEKKVMSIELDYVFIQDDTTIYLLDLVIIHGPWV